MAAAFPASTEMPPRRATNAAAARPGVMAWRRCCCRYRLAANNDSYSATRQRLGEISNDAPIGPCQEDLALPRLVRRLHGWGWLLSVHGYLVPIRRACRRRGGPSPSRGEQLPGSSIDRRSDHSHRSASDLPAQPSRRGHRRSAVGEHDRQHSRGSDAQGWTRGRQPAQPCVSAPLPSPPERVRPFPSSPARPWRNGSRTRGDETRAASAGGGRWPLRHQPRGGGVRRPR